MSEAASLAQPSAFILCTPAPLCRISQGSFIANQGLTSGDCPIMAFSVAEDELRAMDVPPLVGHLATWNYYQSLNTPENQKFVQDFKAFCKAKGLK